MNTPYDEPTRETLRAYLLGTLEEYAHIRVEERLQKDEALASLLEEERHALGQLDLLVDEPVPAGLSSGVLEQVNASRIPDWLYRAAVGTALVLFLGPVIYLGSQTLRSGLGADLAVHRLNQIGLAFKMYANDNRGEKFPPLAPYEDLWIFDASVLYPEYLSDLSVLVSPSVPNSGELITELKQMEAENALDWERVARITAQSYSYVGWATRGPEEFTKLGEERRMMANNEYDNDMKIAGDEYPFYQIRKSIERFQISEISDPDVSTQAKSELIVLFETSEVKKQNPNQGINALYLDGHTRFFESDDPMLDYGDLDILLAGDGD
jgi:prepilin-type processing-associated H-X9-DG protein